MGTPQYDDADPAGDYRRDPDRESTFVVTSFFEHLDQDLAAAGVPTEVRGRLRTEWRTRYEDLVRDTADVPDEAARINTKYVAAVLAGYRALDGSRPDADLIGTLTSAFVEPMAPWVRQGTRALLDAADDPFAAMVALARAREIDDFGAAFDFEHPEDDARTFRADVRRCGYHDFFVAHGAPELTPVLCAFDLSWIEAIDPARHGFTFTRSTTIGTGGRTCPFRFARQLRE